MKVWIKQGVCGDLQPIARKGLGRATDMFHKHGESIYITSLRDGNHIPGSLHYDGLAFDILPPLTFDFSELAAALGSDWDVINEDTHIHCEYDPK